MTLTKDQATAMITQADYLSDETKRALLSKIEAQGLTQDVLDEIQDILQKDVDALFADSGLYDASASPEEEKIQTEMLDAVASARDEYEETMLKLQKEASDIVNDTAKQMDAAQAQAIKDSLAS